MAYDIDEKSGRIEEYQLTGWQKKQVEINRLEDLYPGEGTKHDQDKLPYHLLSVCATEEMLKVLQFGANKYTENNWRKGFKWTRLLAAASRHLFAYMRGEDRDPETGYLHTAHLMCCAMFLTEHSIRNLGQDDRYKETV